MKITKTEEKINSENKKAILKEIDKKISKKVFINLLIAIAIMTYFCILSVVYKNIHVDGIVGVVKVTTLVFLAITIILIELAYKKESKTLFVHVLEALAIAAHSLTTMHIIKIYNIDFKNYILSSSYVFSIYYVLKTILINTMARREYLKNMSDIPEIIKKDEPRKKEATKKENKQLNEEVVEPKKEEPKKVEVNIVEEKTQKQEQELEKEKEILEQPKEEISTSEKIANLRAKMEKLMEKEKNIKSKMENNSEDKIEEKALEPEEQKENTEPQEDNKEDKKEVEEAPKPKRKRGRPKKEVKVND